MDNAIRTAEYPAQSVDIEKPVTKALQRAPCRSSSFKQLEVVDNTDDTAIPLNREDLVKPSSHQRLKTFLSKSHPSVDLTGAGGAQPNICCRFTETDTQACGA